LKSFICNGKSQQQNLTNSLQVVYKNVTAVPFHTIRRYKIQTTFKRTERLSFKFMRSTAYVVN